MNSKNKIKEKGSEKTQDEVAAILFDIGSIVIRAKRRFRYDSGILSPVYTDNRLLISHPKERERIVSLFIREIKKNGLPDVIAGTATAGIPHAAFIAQRLKLPMVYVRAEPKNHGKGNQVEGSVKRGQKVLVVEDLISTGGSSIRVIEALRKLGAIVEREIAIFTYSLKESVRNFNSNKIKLHTLTNLEHSAKIAVEKGFLKQKDVETILSWTKDPRGWGKKMGFE